MQLLRDNHECGHDKWRWVRDHIDAKNAIITSENTSSRVDSVVFKHATGVGAIGCEAHTINHAVEQT
jgi:hypothetical protein